MFRLIRKIVGYFALTLVLCSCGSESGQFRLKGHLKNFNQGEFYIYSPDGGMAGLDTLQVVSGKFSFATRLEGRATFVIIFPNYSEHVVFGASGVEARLEGDASHLRETKITGSEDNEAMTAFRLKTNDLTPPEAKKAAEAFIRDNPKSVVSSYILRKTFIDNVEPDYTTAFELATLMSEADEDNVRMTLLAKSLSDLMSTSQGKKLPNFGAKDINGDSIGRDYLKSEANVLFTFSTWNADSQAMFRELKKMKKENEGKLSVISFCLDASRRSCTNFLRRDSALWAVVCDGDMWLSPTLQQLGMQTVPATIIADKQGNVVARNLRGDKLRDKIKELTN